MPIVAFASFVANGRVLAPQFPRSTDNFGSILLFLGSLAAYDR